jgi:hypothetical protein
VVLGGRFEVASAAQPNAELEIQKLTVCHALAIDALGRGNLQEGKNICNCLQQKVGLVENVVNNKPALCLGRL